MSLLRVPKVDGQNKFRLEDVPPTCREMLIADGYGYSLFRQPSPLSFKTGIVRVEVIPDSEYYTIVTNDSVENARAWYTKHNNLKDLQTILDGLERSFE